MHFVSERRDHRLIAVGSALIALAFIAALAFAGRAQAAENIYWDNYGANTISFTGIDGSGGGLLNLTGVPLVNPEGMAYDSASNRLYVASSGEGANLGAIVYVGLNGGGSGVFTAPGATTEYPEGIAVDPANRTLYWINTGGAGSIGWARLDGSAGGTLNTSGATFESPYKIAVDPVHGKVYWANTGTTPNIISFANADNSGGGGDLDLTGATPPEVMRGIVVDPVGNRIYWLDNAEEAVSFASLSGGGGGDVNMTGSFFNSPYGLALDPSIGRLYWGNYNNGTEALGAIGFVNSGGGAGGGISPASAPVDGPQDPVILKSPSGTGAPTMTRDPSHPAELACSTGSWADDFAGSFVYQAPQTFAYQWTLNGAVLGSGPDRITASAAGTYACTVTATNQTGSATQTSGAVTVNAAKAKLTVKPKTAKVKAGGSAKFKVKVLNQGDLQTGNVKVCVKIPKKAKKVLKAKCRSIGKIAALQSKAAKVKVKVKPAAVGSYKIKIQVKGTPGKAVKARIKVIG